MDKKNDTVVLMNLYYHRWDALCFFLLKQSLVVSIITVEVTVCPRTVKHQSAWHSNSTKEQQQQQMKKLIAVFKYV